MHMNILIDHIALWKGYTFIECVSFKIIIIEMWKSLVIPFWIHNEKPSNMLTLNLSYILLKDKVSWKQLYCEKSWHFIRHCNCRLRQMTANNWIQSARSCPFAASNHIQERHLSRLTGVPKSCVKVIAVTLCLTNSRRRRRPCKKGNGEAAEAATCLCPTNLPWTRWTWRGNASLWGKTFIPSFMLTFWSNQTGLVNNGIIWR